LLGCRFVLGWWCCSDVELPTLIFHPTFFPSIFRVHSSPLDIHIRSTTFLLLLLLLSSIHNFHNHPKWKLIAISTNKIANLFPRLQLGSSVVLTISPLMVVYFSFFFDILLVK
jgi:hypothetical protein